MDAAQLVLALMGGVAGAVAMALPGVHVNLLALATLALAPAAGPGGVAFLLGALAGAPFGMALSTTLLGASEETQGALPAHQLAQEGRATEAIARLCWGAFAGLALALPVSLLAGPALEALAPRLLAAMPWILLAILAALILTERAAPTVHPRLVVVAWGDRWARGRLARANAPRGRADSRTNADTTLESSALVRESASPRGTDDGSWRIGKRRVHDPHGLLDPALEGSVVDVRVERAWTRGPLSRAAGWGLAVFVLALSGGLGLVALRMGAASPLRLPASPLLPLLAGLFAVPGLLAAYRVAGRLPRARLRAPRPQRGEMLRAAWPGAAASALLGLAPGVTASHVSHLTPRARTPEGALLTLGAVNGGAVVFAALAWRALDKTRAGALVAANALAPPPDALDEAAFLLGAAALALLLVRATSGRLARFPQRPLALAGLALVIAATAATTGAWGLAVLAVAALVGALPPRLGVRRGLCMGVILVPATLWAWGVV